MNDLNRHRHDNLPHDFPMDGNARVAAAANGATVGTRRKINVKSADGTVTITGTDDVTGEEVILDLSTNPATGPLVAALTVSPTAGIEPWTVTADASGSTDGVPIRTYAFNWGDGNTTPAQSSPTATHTYSTPPTGTVTYTITVTVTDANNATSTASKAVSSSAPAAGGIDLIVQSITASPASPVAGDAVTFTVTVKNQGSAAVPAGTAPGQNIGVGIYIDTFTGAPATYTNNNAGLAGGASFTQAHTAGWAPGPTWTATAGSHTVRAWVDDAGQIAELQDNNNTLDMVLNVAAPGTQANVIDRGTTQAITAGTVLDSGTFTPADNSLLVVIVEGTTI